MEHGWHSVEHVAELLGLNVRTVRGYIRDGRLKAVRIGKQYRIAPADLAQLTGTGPPAAGVRVEVSAVVDFDNLAPGAADRISTLLVAGAQLSPLRVQAVYDDNRARLKLILLGDVAAAAAALQLIDNFLDSENTMLFDTPRQTGDTP